MQGTCLVLVLSNGTPFGGRLQSGSLAPPPPSFGFRVSHVVICCHFPFSLKSSGSKVLFAKKSLVRLKFQHKLAILKICSC